MRTDAEHTTDRDMLFLKVGTWLEARATGRGIIALLLAAALAGGMLALRLCPVG